MLPSSTRLSVLWPLVLLGACATTPPAGAPDFPVIGGLTTYDPQFLQVIAADARIEQLATGFTWAEGPSWVRRGGYLLFTDVPENTLYRWSPTEGLEVWLQPSGYAGPPLPSLREAGANGLFAEASGLVLLADSGSRLVARLDPLPRTRTILASHFQGLRFNSPNDLVAGVDGKVYFTDPPFGLTGLNDSPVKELPFNGVYRLDIDGSVHLLDDQLSYPNGVALSPDERTLYVSNTDDRRPLWMAYTLDAAGQVIERRPWADASDLRGPGLPDGMAVAADGTVFATSPGGVLVVSADGRRLGRIETGGPISNCAFGDDGYTLYLTSKHLLARVRVRVRGLGF